MPTEDGRVHFRGSPVGDEVLCEEPFPTILGYALGDWIIATIVKSNRKTKEKP